MNVETTLSESELAEFNEGLDRAQRHVARAKAQKPPPPIGYMWVVQPQHSPALLNTMRGTMADCLRDFEKVVGEDVWAAMEASGAVISEVELTLTGVTTLTKSPNAVR